MRPASVAATLSAIPDRGAGTDAERRAAETLARELQQAGLTVTVEPFWCRPNTALAHAWHALLALAGSLGAVASPRIGAALIVFALLSLIADELTGRSLGRRLTHERASQNVLAARSRPRDGVTLIVAAHLNAERRGLVHRLRSPVTHIQRAADGRLPGWLAWLAVVMVWLLVCALLRANGARGAAIGALQLPPTVAAVLALALLVELGTARYGDGGDGAATAAALVTALAVAPPAHLNAQLLLAGAGNLGVRHHLRTRTPRPAATTTVVLGITGTAGGPVRWWRSDGPLAPLRFLPALQQICARTAAEHPGFDARPTRGRGRTPALPARAAGLPAIALGTDGAADDLLSFALIAVDGIDAYVDGQRSAATPTPA